MKFTLLVFLISILFLSCNKSDTPKENSTKKSKAQDSSFTELHKYDLSSKNPTILKLPKDLVEISGMTMTPDGRLFAEQDEKGLIYEVDYSNGKIIKKFGLGNPVIKGDFEDIVFANNKFYLLKSNGDIYEFEEGEDGKNVDYQILKSGLRHSNDVEGLCYDPETNSLLLACKGRSGLTDDEDKAVYSYSLDKMELDTIPRFLIPVDKIKKTFNPSGIQRNPKTGTFFIIAANGNEIIEISKKGDILGRHELPKTIHGQPEGITFDKNNNLYISNEGKEGNGYIVIYPYRN